MSNLTIRPLEFCCGATELGNFNYIDPPDGKKMTHYHKVGGGWKSQPNAAGTTKEEIQKQIQYQSGGVVCSTGAGQEYLEPILSELGFRKVFTFINPGHAQTPVHIWCYSKHEVKPETLNATGTKKGA